MSKKDKKYTSSKYLDKLTENKGVRGKFRPSAARLKKITDASAKFHETATDEQLGAFSKEEKKSTVNYVDLLTLILDRWNIPYHLQQELCGISDINYFNDVINKKAEIDSFEIKYRINLISRINDLLFSLFSEDSVIEWLNNNNEHPMFNEKPPLDLIFKSSNESLLRIIKYLNSAVN